MNKTKAAGTTLAVGIFIFTSVFASAVETGIGSLFAQNQKISNQIENQTAMNQTAAAMSNDIPSNPLSARNSTNVTQPGMGSSKQLENLIGNNTQELANSTLANMTANATEKMANMTANIPQKIANMTANATEKFANMTENIRNVTFGNQTKKE